MTSQSRYERSLQFAAARPGTVRWASGDPRKAERDAHNAAVDLKKRAKKLGVSVDELRRREGL